MAARTLTPGIHDIRSVWSFGFGSLALMTASGALLFMVFIGGWMTRRHELVQIHSYQRVCSIKTTLSVTTLYIAVSQPRHSARYLCTY